MLFQTQLINKSMKDAKWQPQHTKILIDWADKAMCYRWLHTKCTHKYTLANAWFTIPVIIISTLTGVGNFAQERFPEDIRQIAVITIGGFMEKFGGDSVPETRRNLDGYVKTVGPRKRYE